MSNSKYPNYRVRKTNREMCLTNTHFDELFLGLAKHVLAIVNQKLGTSMCLTDKSKPTGNGALPRQIVAYLMSVVYEVPPMAIARSVQRHRTAIIYSLGSIEDRRDDLTFDTLMSELEVEVQRDFPVTKIPQAAFGVRHTPETYQETRYTGRFS